MQTLEVDRCDSDFCSGAHLEGLGDDSLDYMTRASEAARALSALTTPTIAKVDGAAGGAGWNLALSCAGEASSVQDMAGARQR